MIASWMLKSVSADHVISHYANKPDQETKLLKSIIAPCHNSNSLMMMVMMMTMDDDDVNGDARWVMVRSASPPRKKTSKHGTV